MKFVTPFCKRNPRRNLFDSNSHCRNVEYQRTPTLCANPRVMRKNEPVYQALWADNKDFDQVLISPVMIQDHMPDKLLDALEKAPYVTALHHDAQLFILTKSMTLEALPSLTKSDG
ncbi:hypothetical protein HPB52_016512 [Rhipicephalus sanguineus]|uniref:Uncharacterized protein n=1 Tax=Rhipicephalus sanguineus TaxID=34632 RepID=A0A9D4SYQ3_RHISA|nr:hypothetical protein HPB52_016512 [Rhipicephalus sanguineus]